MYQHVRGVQQHPRKKKNVALLINPFLPCGHSLSHFFSQNCCIKDISFEMCSHFAVWEETPNQTVHFLPPPPTPTNPTPKKSNRGWWIWNWWQIFMRAGTNSGDESHCEKKKEKWERGEVVREIARWRQLDRGRARRGGEGSEDTPVDLWLLV